MTMHKIFIGLLLLITFASCHNSQQVCSPDNNIKVAVFHDENGKIGYEVQYKNKKIIQPSYFGFDFKDLPSIQNNLKIINISRSSFDETWEMPWGEQHFVRNNYNEMIVSVAETVEPFRKFDIIFRVFNDGIGFRFSFPEQDNLKDFILTDENTEFQLTGNHQIWWQPGDWDIYEHLYNHTRISEIDAIAKRGHKSLAQSYIPENAINTPATLKTEDGIYLSFHEANLTNYPGMTLKIDTSNFQFTSELVGSEKLQGKAKLSTPFSTPWRTIQISETAGELIESKLIVNLNEPNKIGDVSYFKPTKYVGIWWDMHLERKSWDLYDKTTGKPHGKHGATTEYAKELIDFAATNNIHGILVEGWNTGWEEWSNPVNREGVFDFVTPYPDYNLQEIVRYGKKKGVELIMHHETSAAINTYEKQMDSAYKLIKSLDVHAVKTGYVGKLAGGEYHHGQLMVNHYRKVIETAAKYQIAVNAHEPIKPTGLRRTYPNEISREGLRGQEFNAWSVDGGNPPSHIPTIAFTRMLAGPIDYTPGIFNIKLNPYKPNNQVNTTIAHQLALYVVIYSPIQMVPDLTDYYQNHPMFQFIRDVAVDWEQSKVINGEIGEFVTIARQERGKEQWFVGSITNEDARNIELSLDFLSPDINYIAYLYQDGTNAHWNDNPTSYKIDTFQVDTKSVLHLKLASGGGCAISIFPESSKK